MRVSVFNLNNPIWFTNGDVLEYISTIQFILMYIVLRTRWLNVNTAEFSTTSWKTEWVVTRPLTRNNLKGSIAIHKCPRQKDWYGWVHLLPQDLKSPKKKTYLPRRLWLQMDVLVLIVVRSQAWHWQLMNSAGTVVQLTETDGNIQQANTWNAFWSSLSICLLAELLHHLEERGVGGNQIINKKWNLINKKVKIFNIYRTKLFRF